MRKAVALTAGLCALVMLATAALAMSVEYLSQHPVPHKFGGGFCYIDYPHIHNYQPADRRMYREHGGQLYFVGDPAPYDYDGPRHAYYGAHPVAEAEVRLGVPVYCYLKGPHYHWYQPPPHAHFQMTGGAYWYVGKFPRAYYDDRPRYAAINEAYAPMPYARPVVDVHVAPPAVQAEVSFGGPGWSASFMAAGPEPMPPPVFIPPPVLPVVPVPAPVGVEVNIGVGASVGGPPMVPVPVPVYGGRGYVEERHHPGRHEGWRGRGRGFDPFDGPPGHRSAPMPPPHGQPAPMGAPQPGGQRYMAMPQQGASPRAVPQGRQPPPSRFMMGNAPVREPLFNRSAPSRAPNAQPSYGAQPAPQTRPAMGPTRGPAPSAPAQGPTRGPAAAPPRMQSDRRH